MFRLSCVALGFLMCGILAFVFSTRKDEALVVRDVNQSAPSSVVSFFLDAALGGDANIEKVLKSIDAETIFRRCISIRSTIYKPSQRGAGEIEVSGQKPSIAAPRLEREPNVDQIFDHNTQISDSSKLRNVSIFIRLFRANWNSSSRLEIREPIVFEDEATVEISMVDKSNNEETFVAMLKKDSDTWSIFSIVPKSAYSPMYDGFARENPQCP